MIKVDATKKAERDRQSREKEVSDLVQSHLDAKAKSYGYDDIKSAVTYAEEPAVPLFQAQGRAFRAWRSRVWAHCYEVLALVQDGSIPAPENSEFLASLPHIEVPT